MTSWQILVAMNLRLEIQIESLSVFLLCGECVKTLLSVGKYIIFREMAGSMPRVVLVVG